MSTNPDREMCPICYGYGKLTRGKSLPSSKEPRLWVNTNKQILHDYQDIVCAFCTGCGVVPTHYAVAVRLIIPDLGKYVWRPLESTVLQLLAELQNE